MDHSPSEPHLTTPKPNTSTQQQQQQQQQSQPQRKVSIEDFLCISEAANKSTTSASTTSHAAPGTTTSSVQNKLTKLTLEKQKTADIERQKSFGSKPTEGKEASESHTPKKEDIKKGTQGLVVKKK